MLVFFFRERTIFSQVSWKRNYIGKVINKFPLVSGYGYVGPRAKKLRFLENDNLQVPL